MAGCSIIILLIMILQLTNCYGAGSSVMKFKEEINDAGITNTIIHLEPDRYIHGNIIYSQLNSLLTTNETTSMNIAGSSYGYREGVGTSAKFSYIYGFYQVNQTTVLLVDTYINCFRFVFRTTRETGLLAGVCGRSGFQDGVGSDARFSQPLQVKLDHTDNNRMLIVDYSNHALRSISMHSLRVSTVVTSDLRYPRSCVWNSDNSTLFILVRGGITSIHWSTKSMSLITSSGVSLPYDQTFYEAVASTATDIVRLYGSYYVIVYSNSYVYMVDMESLQGWSLCVHTEDDCSFPTRPITLTMDGLSVLLGSSGAITRYSGFDCALEIACQNGERVVSEMGCQCQCHAGYSDRDCAGEIDECRSSPCIRGSCEDQLDAYQCQCEVGYTGDNCYLEIDECQSSPCIHGDCNDQLNAFNCSCEPGYGGIACDLNIDDCLSFPCLHGACNDLLNGYNCLCESGYEGNNCDVITGYDVSSCTVARSCEIVKNRTLYLMPHQESTLVELNQATSLKLVKGSDIQLTQTTLDGSLCTYTLKAEETKLFRRLLFQAVYSVNCELLNSSFIQAVVQPMLSQVKDVIMTICASDCEMSSDVDSGYSCQADNITFSWPTDLLFTQEVEEIPLSLHDRLKTRIRRYSYESGPILPAMNSQQRVLVPLSDDEGMDVTLRLLTTCVNTELSYHESTDSCQ